MDKLYFLTGPLQGATAELLGEEITIGRASDNGICIDDESISDHHAIINRQNRECILRDLQTAKGTTVRGNKIIVVTLEDSDRISFGSVEAEFTTTEVKLHVPKTAVLPPPPMQPTWPKHKVSSRNSEGSPSFMSMFKAAMAKLLALVVMSGILGGAYVAYKKYGNMDLTGEQTSPEQSAASAQTLQSLNTSAMVSNPTAQPALSTPVPPQQPITTAAPPATTAPVTASQGVSVSASTVGTTAQQQQSGSGMSPASAPTQIASSAIVSPQSVVAPPAPPPVVVPGAYSVPEASTVSVSAPASRISSAQQIASPTRAVTTDIGKLKAEDWVAGLPAQAQTRYFDIRSSLRGDERVDAFRSWMALWKRYLRDPNLSLVEFDFIQVNIDNHTPSLYTKPSPTEKQAWQRNFQVRISTLDSMDNMLRGLRARGVKHRELLKMIGDYTDTIAKERSQLVGINQSIAHR